MPVIYDGKKLVPAPQFSCLKEYQTAEDGTILGKSYQIQVKGKFVAWSGSPNSSGVFWTGSGYPPDEVPTDSTMLKSQLVKQDAIRQLFAAQGRVFEVQALDGSMSLRCNPRIVRVDIPEGRFTTLSDYIITMECNSIFVNGLEDDGEIEQSFISKASEEWNMEVSDDKLMTYRLTHSVNAIGKTTYDETGEQVKKPWEYARDYVLEKIQLGLDNARMVAADVIDGSDLQAFNYLRGQSLNELTGSFGVNETWLCYNGGSAYEEFAVNARTSLEGRTTVSISGTITGLAQYNNTTRELLSSRFVGASSKWATVSNTLFGRAQTQSGFTLNPAFLTRDVGKNEVTGTITYSYEFDDRPAALLVGAKSTNLTQTDDNVADVFASIPVLGRSAGPVLQAMGTVTSKKRIVSLTAQMTLATYGTPTVSRPNSNSIFTDYIPQGTQVFVESDKEDWTAMTGQYTRSIAFVYQ